MAATLLLDREYVRSIEASCGLCHRPEFEEKRQEWGCDHELEEPWDYIECFRCDDKTRAYCRTCSGEGLLPLVRCPWSYVGPRERAVVEAVIWLDAHALPYGLGWGELPASFVDALELVAHERLDIQRRERDREVERMRSR